MRRRAYGLAVCLLCLAAPVGAQPPDKQADKPSAVASLRWSNPDQQNPRRYEGDPPPARLSLRLPAPDRPGQATAKASAAGLTARYLPPVLAEPDRPNGVRNWEIDLPEARKDWSPGPFVHPAGKSAEDLAASCAAPPDPAWLTEMKASWALDGYGNAEPMVGQQSYWPFPCY